MGTRVEVSGLSALPEQAESYTDAVNALKASKLFSGMLVAELQTLEQTAQLNAYKAGRHIFQEGEQGDGLYIIVQGKVAITKLIGQNERCLLAELGPGDFFGEMAVLDDQPRSATATAKEDSQVYFLLRDVLLGVLQRQPEAMVNLLREFSIRMRDFNQQYVAQMLQSERLTLFGRLAHTFVRQFRNPLRIISSAADVAASDTASPQMRQIAKDGTRKQVDRLTHLINEFLEFTRVSPSTVVLAKANYAELVTGFISEIRSELVGRSVSVELENEPPDVNVLVDPVRVGHVFQNLVYNACDSMPEGGRIKLRFEQGESEVITEIEETGCRLPPEVAAHLFDPLTTYNKGLELAICRRIIEDHHGKIRVCGERVGGTTFIFNLPLARLSPSVAAS